MQVFHQVATCQRLHVRQCSISFAFEISLVGYLYTTVFELDQGFHILSRTVSFSFSSYVVPIKAGFH